VKYLLQRKEAIYNVTKQMKMRISCLPILNLTNDLFLGWWWWYLFIVLRRGKIDDLQYWNTYGWHQIYKSSDYPWDPVLCLEGMRSQHIQSCDLGI